MEFEQSITKINQSVEHNNIIMHANVCTMKWHVKFVTGYKVGVVIQVQSDLGVAQ